jgi:hypothetical protein
LISIRVSLAAKRPVKYLTPSNLDHSAQHVLH